MSEIDGIDDAESQRNAEFFDAEIYDKVIDIVHEVMDTIATESNDSIITCFWSMGGMEEAIAFRDDTLFTEGKVVFDYDGGTGVHVRGEVINNPTHRDLFKAADRAIVMSGDPCSIFLEAATDTGEVLTAGVRRFKLRFGS